MCLGGSFAVTAIEFPELGFDFDTPEPEVISPHIRSTPLALALPLDDLAKPVAVPEPTPHTSVATPRVSDICRWS